MIPIIDIALKEVGYKEYPDNSNKTKYGKWFGIDGVPWCGIFVSWVYDKAGIPLNKIQFEKGFAGCQFALEYFKRNGLTTSKPVPGDLVFYDWNNDNRVEHVGLFQCWTKLADGRTSSTSFSAIEGNTANGNNSNGGQVMIRYRSIDVNKITFVHLPNNVNF